MFSRHHTSFSQADMITSTLYDQRTFYPAFLKDLGNSYEEIIIESPFLTMRRLAILRQSIRKLGTRHAKIIVNTRHPDEHEDEYMRLEAIDAIGSLQQAGVQVLFTGGHHRKLAILDRRVLWEGSLNILSQSESCEVMRRIASTGLCQEMLKFTGLSRWCQ